MCVRRGWLTSLRSHKHAFAHDDAALAVQVPYCHVCRGADAHSRELVRTRRTRDTATAISVQCVCAHACWQWREPLASLAARQLPSSLHLLSHALPACARCVHVALRTSVCAVVTAVWSVESEGNGHPQSLLVVQLTLAGEAPAHWLPEACTGQSFRT